MSKDQLTSILEISAQFPPPENATPDQLREWFEMINAQTPIAQGVSIERVSAGPAGADFIRLPGCDESRVIIYYHGGGFLFGSSRSHRVIATHLARAANCCVLAADYRLAPENPAPAAHDDAVAVYRWALDKGFAAKSIALCGDSAGGNLALSTAVRAKKEGLQQPVSVMLMSPWLDLEHSGESHKENAYAPPLSPELMGLFLACYATGIDPKSAQITPFYEDFTGLAPVLVHVGSWEMLRDDSVRVVEKLKAAGVDADLKIFDGMIHSWQLFAPMLDEAMASIEEAADFMKSRFETGVLKAAGE